MSPGMRASIAAAIAMWPALVRADEPSPRAIEVSLAWGLARMIQPSVDHARELSAWNGGLAISGRVLVRAGASVSPLLEMGATPLYRSDERVAGSPSVARSSLAARHVLFGLAFGRGWLRPWLGAGAYRLTIRSTLDGVTIQPTSWSFGYAGGLEARLVSSSRLFVGAHAGVELMTEAGTTALIAGAIVSGDAFTW